MYEHVIKFTTRKEKVASVLRDSQGAGVIRVYIELQ